MVSFICYGIFLASLLSLSVDAACVCTCGSNTYYPTTSCSSASNCATICYNTYGGCTTSNTYGCCGSSCAYYSSSSSANCQCQCSTSYLGSTTTVGSTYLSGCTTSSCQSSCSSIYPLSCGLYTNNAYCSSATIRASISYYGLVLWMILAIVSIYSNEYTLQR